MIERIAILGHRPAGNIGGPGVARGRFSRHDHRLEPQRGTCASSPCRWAQSIRLQPIPIEAARASQVVLLSVPIYATLDFMEKLAPVLGSEHLVTDVGSTKRVISEAGSASLQHSRARSISSRPSHGRQGARRRSTGRCKSFSRRGLALHRRSRLRNAPHTPLRWSKVGASGSPPWAQEHSISIPRVTTSWSPGSAICPSLSPLR